MDPLNATLEEFGAEDYTHVSCHWPRCRMTRMRPKSWLPKISMGLTADQLARRLRCAPSAGSPLQSVRGRFPGSASTLEPLTVLHPH
jgi:hypothetical protein